MDTKTRILQLLRKKKSIQTSDVVHLTGISRQAAAKHLRELVWSRKLAKEGSTRSARYFLASHRSAEAVQAPSVTVSYPLKGLEEDRVFSQLDQRLSLKQHLSPAAFRVVQYAFTEMLNNAIDHSRAARVRIAVRVDQGVLFFSVTDHGIGAFENVRRKFRLKNHYEAAEHLLKGKQTTDPENHSGQGIFFTSRIADRFTLESAKLKLDIDNLVQDAAFVDGPDVKGTQVTFQIKAQSRRDLGELFSAYTDGDLEFDKTEVRVRLSRSKGSYVSRSEAKRLLFGLDKFRRIIFDFKKVSAVGQGFVDEIFHVFRSRHPEIHLDFENAAPGIIFLIQSAKK